ncbi:CRISPR system Cascade subunit CasB [Streptomyces sp. SAI-170]|uniref:type I-E CRISPR-associated protein Cse2/CasB n=1 Tax=Streptomyces sp. SAI-170 TaxID=3377729 RepID=UPI003C7B823D
MTTTTPPAPARTGLYRAFVDRVETLCARDPGVRVALRKGLRRDVDDVRGLHRVVAEWLPENCPPAEERAFYAVAAMIADRPRHTFHSAGHDDPPDSPQPPAGAQDTEPSGTATAFTASAPGTPDAVAVTDTDADADADAGAGNADEEPRQRRVRRDSLGASFARAVLAQSGRGVREDTAEARLNLLTRQSLPGLHRHLPGSIRLLRDAGTGIDFAVLLDDLATWPYRSKTIARRWLQDYYRTRRAPIDNAAQQRDTDGEEDTAPAN